MENLKLSFRLHFPRDAVALSVLLREEITRLKSMPVNNTFLMYNDVVYMQAIYICKTLGTLVLLSYIDV